jgi:hypothetical protein
MVKTIKKECMRMRRMEEKAKPQGRKRTTQELLPFVMHSQSTKEYMLYNVTSNEENVMKNKPRAHTQGR